MPRLQDLALAALLLAAPLLGSSLADAPTQLREDLDLVLEGPGWVAWRFNLTPGSDLSVGYHLRPCDPADSMHEVHAFVRIHDGGESVTHSLAGSGPGLWSPRVDVGVQGETVRVRPDLSAAGLRDGQCSGDFWGGAVALPEDDTLTVILLNSAPHAWYNVTAMWTTGVTSWDVAAGPGVARTLSEFSQGASASVWGAAPVGTVGALLHEDVETQGAAFGWFLPVDILGPNVYSCRQNGADCAGPPGTFGQRWLSSAGPTSWDFDVQLKAQATQEPARILGVFDVPSGYAPALGG